MGRWGYWFYALSMTKKIYSYIYSKYNKETLEMYTKTKYYLFENQILLKVIYLQNMLHYKYKHEKFVQNKN